MGSSQKRSEFQEERKIHTQMVTAEHPTHGVKPIQSPRASPQRSRASLLELTASKLTDEEASDNGVLNPPQGLSTEFKRLKHLDGKN